MALIIMPANGLVAGLFGARNFRIGVCVCVYLPRGWSLKRDLKRPRIKIASERGLLERWILLTMVSKTLARSLSSINEKYFVILGNNNCITL